MTTIKTIVIESCNRVFDQLGLGHNEKIYHKALAYELNCLGINIDTEKHIVVTYKDSKNNSHHLESLRIECFRKDINPWQPIGIKIRKPKGKMYVKNLK